MHASPDFILFSTPLPQNPQTPQGTGTSIVHCSVSHSHTSAVSVLASIMPVIKAILSAIDGFVQIMVFFNRALLILCL